MSKSTSHNSLLPWITAILMVTGIAILAAMYWNKNVTVQDIKVNKLVYSDYEKIKEMAAIPTGIKPDSVNLDELVQRVEKLDYVRTVTPYIEPNGSLRLNIAEREPLAMIINGSERIYVDAEGVKLPILEGKTRDVPLLYGYNTNKSDTLKRDGFLQVRNFLMQAKIDGFGWATISEVAFDKDIGVVALSYENGVKLIFGQNEFELKLDNWKAFYAQVVKTKGINKMQQVDLRFTNQVVTREI